jgi:hypothetical protein
MTGFLTGSMAKSIKKSYKYLFVIAGIIIVLPTILFSFMRIPAIQTLMVKRITGHLSQKITSTVSVGKMDYYFFNRLKLQEVLIKDRHGDTLIYSPHITVGVKSLNFRKRYLTFGKITAEKPVFALITDTTGEMNLSWYLDLLTNRQDSLNKKSLTVKINRVEVTDGRFLLINRNGSRSKIPTDFSNLQISGINGTLNDFLIQNDTTSFDLTDIAFREKEGFTVDRINSKAVIIKNEILFHTAQINCDSSILNITLVKLQGDSITMFSNFAEDVRMEIALEKSLLSSSDLRYFVPLPEGINESIWLSGKVSGTLSELRGRNINISYGDFTRLGFDFDLSGLPEIKNSFIYLGINYLRTNAEDIEGLEFPGRGPLTLPDQLFSLGTFSFDGSFTGFPEDFVAYGNLRTSEGTVSTDISFRPGEKDSFKVNGLMRGSGIALGRLIGNPEIFGEMSMKADIDGNVFRSGKFNGKLTGSIDSIVMNKYKYRNILVSGLFSEKTWDGDVRINDRNIKLDLLGMFDFRNELPEFDFSLNLAKANLHNLNFSKSDTTSALSLLATANFKGSNMDNLDGEIKLLNSILKKNGKTLELYDFSVKTFMENEKPAISLRTDYIDADLRGNYNFSGINTAIRKVLFALMPSKFKKPDEKENPGENNFTFSINLKNTDNLNSFFRTGLLVSDRSFVKGSLLNDSIIKISANAKTLSFKGLSFREITVDVNILSPELTLNVTSPSLNLLGQTELKGFNASLNTVPDNFAFSLNWDNEDQVLNRGSFIARGNIGKSEAGNNNPVMNIRFDSTDIYSHNNLWKISPSNITIDTSSISINKLYIRNKENYYLVDGAVSANNSDTLRLEFKGIDISWINAFISGKNSSDPFPLNIKGKLNGNVFLSGMFNNPLLEANLRIDKFALLESEYGDLTVISAWNKEKKSADIRAFNNLDNRKMIDISGYYNPAGKRFNLTGTADKLPVDALNPLLKFFASGISGTASGVVNLAGETGKLVLKGALMAENTSIMIDYLQTKYKLNDSIRFSEKGILFRNVKVADDKGNNATLNGTVSHRHFKDWSADLTINTNETMVLNTRPKDNDLFYGTAFATGVTTIESGAGGLSFDVSARTGRNTKFFIPLNSSETISDYSFITFLKHDTLDNSEGSPGIKSQPVESTAIELNFDLEVTPEAEVQLIFDPKVGDIMKGRGSGKLNISLDKKGVFRISGDYIIEDGDYLFTLGNILNKEFSVENGGEINFNGDIDDAEINIKAIYRLKASLYDILKDESFSEKIPVECQISLSGKLFNPVVNLEINLPSADEATRTYLKNVITTEEEKSRQFLYLLVMNSFYSDPSYGSSLTSTTETGTSAMAVTTTEMLSNQLSNWLSQISNDFDIGVNYIPGQKNFNDQEVQVALSTQLLDDRVIINGNLDVRGVGALSDNADQLTGDFDIEYKPKFSDKIRFKVFNRFNNPYTGKQSQYTQGFGVFFRQEFDKFSDLFRKKEKPVIKKEKEPKEKGE